MKPRRAIVLAIECSDNNLGVSDQVALVLRLLPEDHETDQKQNESLETQSERGGNVSR